MFGLFSDKNRVGFRDLAKLRSGTFKGVVRVGNRLHVRFQPPGFKGVVTIKDVLPGSLHKVESFDPEDDYAYYMVLFAAENGDAPFLKQYLGENGIISDLIKRIDDMNKNYIISNAALKAKTREMMRGPTTTLKRVTDDMKTVSEAQQARMPWGPKRKPPTIY